MNFFEILIILLFVVLPLLQQVLGQRKEGAPDLDEEGAEGERMPGIEGGRAHRPRGGGTRAPAPPQQRRPRPEEETAVPSTPPGGWSADWGEWPGAAEEDVFEEAVAEGSTAEDLPAEAPQGEAAVGDRDRVPERSEAARAATTVVSLEPLHVNRAAEHARFHERSAVPLPPVKRRAPRLAALLQKPDDLRQAVVLAEVVGRPVALRDLPDPRGLI